MTQIYALPIHEIHIWRAYFAEEPDEDFRQDFNATQICAVIRNSVGGGKATPNDFMPFQNIAKAFDFDEYGNEEGFIDLDRE